MVAFILNTAGNTIPEYALIVAILAAGACVAYMAAGSQANSILTSTSRLTEELAGGQLGTFGENRPGHQPNLALAPAGHQPPHSSWIVRHAAVVIGSIAWIATMTVGLLALRVFRRVSLGKQGGDSSTDLPSDGVEPTSYDRLAEKRQQMLRLVTRNLEHTGSVQARVHHMMSKYVTTVRPNTPISAASEMMSSLCIHHLLVCDEDGQLIGIVNDTDLETRQGETVQDVMTANPTVSQPNVPIGPAITLMLQRKISCLPVVDQGRICGVLTTTDVMLSCQCMLHVLESNTPAPSSTSSSSEWDESAPAE